MQFERAKVLVLQGCLHSCKLNFSHKCNINLLLEEKLLILPPLIQLLRKIVPHFILLCTFSSICRLITPPVCGLCSFLLRISLSIVAQKPSDEASKAGDLPLYPCVYVLFLLNVGFYSSSLNIKESCSLSLEAASFAQKNPIQS